MPSSSRDALKSLSNLRRGFLAMAVLLFLVGLIFAWRSWETEKEHELLYLTSIVEITGNSLDSYFDTHSRHLQKLANDLLPEGTKVPDRNALLLMKRAKEANPEWRHVVLSQPDGRVLMSDVPISGMPTVNESASFQTAVKALKAAPGLNIGRPLKIGREHAWHIPLRLGIVDEAGRLRFVLTATILLSSQQGFWQNLSLPPASALGLLRDDAYLVSRYPIPQAMDYEEAYGKPRNGRLIEYLRAHDFPARGVTEGFNSVSKANYLFAFHRLARHPLTVFVSTPLSNVQKKWWRQTQFSLVLLVLLLSGGYLVYRWSSRRQLAWEEEREQNAARIQFLAHHDPLTELPNRLLARDRLQQAIAYADRQGSKVALMFLDLDNFKSINDSLGHLIGDALLKEVTLRLNDSLRSVDTLSRQGGDEFLIILNDIREPEDVTRVAENIQDKLAHTFNIENHELASTLSVGVALYPDDGNDFDTLLRKADTAMYNAKASGRNTYRFYTEQMNVDADERLRIRHWLNQGLEKDHFVLYYQPQIDLATGAVIGAEALIRLQHPAAGLVMPGRFIAVAEDSGLIVPIGTWVIRQACRQLAAWHRAGRTELVMAVNLSAAQFRRGDLEECVRRALAENQLAPDSLELELTESILIDDVEEVLAAMQALKALGVRFSIDDFGTGYSSLAYLKRFNVDKLKIDQSFVRNILHDAEDAAIVHAIIQMARSLNIRTIAEGVEDGETQTFLRSQRCDEGQGYFFGRPMPAADFERYLALHPTLD
ncbi:hypothetical protein DLREEDagrD3_08820 [Denitratisoma sp. agr-D3]